MLPLARSDCNPREVQIVTPLGVRLLLITGSFFQAVGVMMVFIQVFQTEQLFNGPNWTIPVAKAIGSALTSPFRLAVWLIAVIQVRRSTSRAGASTGRSFGNAQVSISGLRDAARAEVQHAGDELAQLRATIDELHRSLDAFKRESASRFDDLVSEQKAMDGRMEAIKSDLGGKMAAVALGSSRWQVLGAVCILIGIGLLCGAALYSVPKAIF